jgi:phenylalanyl-tRNA synthetase beta subunit
LVYWVELKDTFQNNFTFNIQYQDPNKTLTDKEVEQIRIKILTKIKEKFGGQVKD